MKEELALTILLSNPILDEITLKRIEHILKHPIDWYTVFRMSLIEKTTFIIFKNLMQYHYLWLLPDSLGVVWNTSYVGNIKRNKQLLNFYYILQEELSHRKIIAVPSSGIMLLCSIYQEMLDVRLLHDIDFFTETNYLPDIDEILFGLNFKKIYINDKDLLINSSGIHEHDVLYSKYVNSTYINVDFCHCFKQNPALYNFLVNSMKNQRTPDYYSAQLFILYLLVLKSWDGSYYFKNIKHYTYSRLIDLHLYKKLFVKFDTTNFFNRIPNALYLIKNIQDVDECLNFFKKEGYLT